MLYPQRKSGLLEEILNYECVAEGLEARQHQRL